MKTRLTVFMLIVFAFFSFTLSQNFQSAKKERKQRDKMKVEASTVQGAQSFYGGFNSNVNLSSQVSAAKAMSVVPEKPSSYVPGEYYAEGFEGGVIPESWQAINVRGDEEWQTASGISHKGNYSAYISYEENDIDSMGVDWLITPQYSAFTGDSLTFYIRPAESGYPPDTLWVLVSKVSEVPADSASLDAAFNDTLVVIPVDTLGGKWYKYSVSLDKYAGQQIYIGFKEFNIWGCGLFLDDVCLGKCPEKDVAVKSLTISKVLKKGDTLFPAAIVENLGSKSQTFTVQVKVGSLYLSSTVIENMASDAVDTVNFPIGFVLEAGDFTAELSVILDGDENSENDALSVNFKVFDALAESQWHAETPLSSPKYYNGAFSYTSKSSDPEKPDTTYIYSLGGINSNIGIVDSIYRYNTISGAWSYIGSMPAGLKTFGVEQVNGKAYIMGGVNDTPSNDSLYIYDIEKNTFTTGAHLPKALSGSISGVYGDSLIYLAGGADKSIPPFGQNMNGVYIYNIHQNKWIEAASLPGIGGVSMAGGVCGNTIVAAGSAGIMGPITSDTVYYGKIDPADPYSITWTKGNLPFGQIGDALSGVWNGKDHKYIFIAGGTSDYFTALTSMWVYDVDKEEWIAGADKPTSIASASQLAPVFRNDSLYMAAAAGMNLSSGATIPSNVNEWFYFGGDKPLTENNFDVAAVSVDFDTVGGTVETVPTATFTNLQYGVKDFTVTMEITPGDYKSEKTVSGLAYNTSKQVSFDSWTPAEDGSYTVKVYTTLTGDEDTTNDTLTSSVYVAYVDVYPYSVTAERSAFVGKETPAPQVSIYNGSDLPQSFKVTLTITPGSYVSRKNVENLEQYRQTSVEFDTWTPSEVGVYTATVYTELAADGYKNNDTLKFTVTALEALKTGEWFSGAPTPLYSNYVTAVSYTKKGATVDDADTSFVMIIPVNTGDEMGSKVSAGKAPAGKDSSYVYNVNTNTWKEAPTLPEIFSNYKAAYAAGKVCVIGGIENEYTSGSVYLYDMNSNKWTKGASMLKPSQGFSLGTYGDSLVYVFGGMNEQEDTSYIHYTYVQAYNVKTNSWHEATPFTGEFPIYQTGTILNGNIALAGGRAMGGEPQTNIINNGQFSKVEVKKSNFSDQIIFGKIDSLNPYNITWKTEAYPDGPSYMLSVSAVESKLGSYVMFTGGMSDSKSYEPLASTIAYNPKTGKWFKAADAGNPAAGGSGVTVTRNDSVYFVVYGGETSDYIEGGNEWLYVGDLVKDTSSVGLDDDNLGPLTYSLSQNYPNPFNPTTTIRYSVAAAGKVELKVFNMLGQEVRALVNEEKNAGVYEVKFNATGMNLASGVYFYRIKAGDFVQTKKLMLIK